MNKSLNTILKKTLRQSKHNWHVMSYRALWSYQTIINNSIGFSPFQLVHSVESVLLIECEIPSLKLEIEILPDTADIEEWIIHLEHIDEQHRDVSTAIKANKISVKVQYDKSTCPQQYIEGDLVLLYDQAK